MKRKVVLHYKDGYQAEHVAEDNPFEIDVRELQRKEGLVGVQFFVELEVSVAVSLLTDQVYAFSSTVKADKFVTDAGTGAFAKHGIKVDAHVPTRQWYEVGSCIFGSEVL